MDYKEKKAKALEKLESMYSHDAPSAAPEKTAYSGKKERAMERIAEMYSRPNEDVVDDEPEEETNETPSTGGGGMFSYVSAFVGLLVVIIVAVGVVIPSITSVVHDTPYLSTGTVGTVLALIPLLIAVVILMLVVSMIGAS